MNFDYWDRRSYIGSGESGIITGDCSDYKSKRRLWEEKAGNVEPKDLSSSKPVQLGLALEPWILDDYAKTLSGEEWLARFWVDIPHYFTASSDGTLSASVDTGGLSGENRNKLHFEHEGMPFLRCSPDGLVLSNFDQSLLWGVDAKLVMDYDKCDMIRGGQLPSYFAAQGRHFCKLMGVRRWDFHCCLIGAYGETVTLSYRDDPATDAEFFDACEEFWKSIEAGDKPPFDGSEGDDTATLIRVGNAGAEDSRQATQAELGKVANLVTLRDQAKKSKEMLGWAKGDLSDMMGDGIKRLTNSDGKTLVTRTLRGAMQIGKAAEELA